MNSEDEKQWNPFEEEDMDENVSKAFEELQKNPDKWMKKMEEEIDDSESEEESEEEESAEEEEEKEEEEAEKEMEEEKKAVKAINPNLSMFVLFLSFTCSFVKNVSFNYQEDSFRDLFKGCGAISMLFMVHRNDGRFAGYG